MFCVKHQKIVALLVLFLSLLGIRIFYLSQKNSFHIDELLSIVLSYYNEYGWTKSLPNNTLLTGAEAKKLIFTNYNITGEGGNLFYGLPRDIVSLYENNRDSPHTNFYYSLLRIFLTGEETGQPKQLIIRAGLLNLLLFSLSFWTFCLLLKFLFPKIGLLLTLTTLAVAFLSPASLANTLYFRPYQLQETFFIVLTYSVLYYYQQKKPLLNSMQYANPLAFITALTLLTGYYALFFVGMLGLAYFIAIKHFKLTPVYFIILILSLACLLYPNYLSGFFGYRATETLDGFNSFSPLLLGLKTLPAILVNGFFTPPTLILVVLPILYLLFKKESFKNISLLPLLLVIIALIFTFIVILIAPFKILRYVMSVYSFFALLIPLILQNTKLAQYKTLLCGFWLIIALYNSLDRDKIVGLTGTDNTLIDKSFLNSSNPIPIVQPHYTWRLPEIIINLDNQQTYLFLLPEEGEI